MAELNTSERVEWPARAVVTAGMPYGNKPLHFGHIGGVFVPADCFARFLRDRIGPENVRFVSGTDCFGSPINEGYRKAVEAGQCTGDIADYVMANHEAQKSTLEDYQISLDIYEGSGIGHAGDVHQMVTDGFIRTLHKNGFLKLSSTLQFYDSEAGTFLNGRQVHGRCPVSGCKSENAYADECDLGHQYEPADLINPVSSITGTVPEMRPVENWYFDLPAFRDFLEAGAEVMEADPEVRAIVPQTGERRSWFPPLFLLKTKRTKITWRWPTSCRLISSVRPRRASRASNWSSRPSSSVMPLGRCLPGRAFGCVLARLWCPSVLPATSNGACARPRWKG